MTVSRLQRLAKELAVLEKRCEGNPKAMRKLSKLNRLAIKATISVIELVGKIEEGIKEIKEML